MKAFLQRAVLATVMLLASVMARAYDFKVDGINYNKTSDTEVEVTSGGDYFGDIRVPSTITVSSKTYSVTSIGRFAFCATHLISIKLPNSVTSIREDAFSDCESLMSIDLSDSLISIGSSAFDGCSSLSSIKLPNSVTSIGSHAFNKCSSLSSIEFSNSITSIESGAFIECKSLSSIKLPNSVTSIGNDAFARCYNLTSIELPNSLTSIGESAFVSCSSLSSIELSDSLISIGRSAFNGCSILSSIELPSSLTSIGDYAFNNCSNINEVRVLSIEPPVAENNSFDSLVVVNSTLYVPTASYELYRNADVWKNWEKIEPIGGGSQGFIAGDIYYNITSESEVEVTNENLGGAGFVGDITIPSTVTYSFKTYTVSSIGERAFANCNGITSVDIPASVKNIGKLAFSNCSALTTVKVAYPEEGPAKVIAENEEANVGTAIGESAFQGCSVLSTIYLGSTVASIGNTAFAACPKIESITVLATEPPVAQSDAFDSEIYSTSTLNVPVVAYDLYKTAPVWSNWATINSIGGSGIADSFVETAVKIEAANGEITVSGAEGGVCRIFDLRGMEVASRTDLSAGESITVKTSELYIVQVTTKDGKNVTRKVMVK